jgi:hypothetical protein
MLSTRPERFRLDLNSASDGWKEADSNPIEEEAPVGPLLKVHGLCRARSIQQT